MSSNARHGFDVLPGVAASLGELQILRHLPTRSRRLVGPWCFLDRFGPLTFAQGRPLDVPPHPHIGLQTVTWLLDGEVLHRDSLGYSSLIQPGQLNLMTAGRGIAHSEETPVENTGALSGVQFWVALPDAHRHGPPSFEHHEALPSVRVDSARVTVILGEWFGNRSPATVFSPVVGLDIALDGAVDLRLNDGFEHAMLLVQGTAVVESETLRKDAILFSPAGRTQVSLRSEAPSRVIVIGGEPFREPVLMWWNFVARTADEIAQARGDWENGRRFGTVQGYPGSRLAAPPFIARPVRSQE